MINGLEVLVIEFTYRSGESIVIDFLSYLKVSNLLLQLHVGKSR